MITFSGPFKAIVFITEPPQTNEYARGFLLHATGALEEELDEAGYKDIDEFVVPDPPRAGLLFFEGCMLSDDSGVGWEGKWRPLRVAEATAMRYGTNPLEENEEA